MLAWHSLVNHNECYRSKKARGKNGRESGQRVGMFKKCISDPCHEIKVLISASFHLNTCYRKELIVSHPERLSLWRDFCHPLFLSLSLFCPLNIALCLLGSDLQCTWKRMNQEETNKSCSGEFWQSIKKNIIIHSRTSFFSICWTDLETKHSPGKPLHQNFQDVTFWFL